MIGAGVAAVAAIVAAFALAGRDSKSSVPASLVRSGPAPAFDERDVVSRRTLSLKAEGLRGRNVLLFFSEGVMCQACFEQIKALEEHVFHLERRRLSLVSITTDPPDVLRDAAAQYGISTPLISDENRDMSEAYAVLGQGMHPNTAGHTFVLVDARGQIRWRRDYTTMFVPPDKLLEAVPKV